MQHRDVMIASFVKCFGPFPAEGPGIPIECKDRLFSVRSMATEVYSWLMLRLPWNDQRQLLVRQEPRNHPVSATCEICHNYVWRSRLWLVTGYQRSWDLIDIQKQVWCKNSIDSAKRYLTMASLVPALAIIWMHHASKFCITRYIVPTFELSL